EALLARLEAALARSEATTQVMQTVAHRAITGSLAVLIIVAGFLVVWQRKARRTSEQVHTSEIKAINPGLPVLIPAQSSGPIELAEQNRVASKEKTSNVSTEGNEPCRTTW